MWSAERASLPVAVRYDDLGPAGHVNNVASLRIVEEARRTFLGRPATPHAPGGLLDVLPDHVRHLIRHQQVDYRAELWWQAEPFVVDIWVGAVGTTSFRLHSAIRTSPSADPAVVVEAVVVLVDEEARRPWPVDQMCRPPVTSVTVPVRYDDSSLA